MSGKRNALCQLPHTRLPVPVTVHDVFEFQDGINPSVKRTLVLVSLSGDVEYFRTFLAMQGLNKETSYIFVPEDCLIYGSTAAEIHNEREHYDTHRQYVFPFQKQNYGLRDAENLTTGDYCVWSVEDRLVFSKVVFIGSLSDEPLQESEVYAFLVSTVISENPQGDMIDDRYVFQAELKDLFKISEFQELQNRTKFLRWNRLKEIELNPNGQGVDIILELTVEYKAPYMTENYSVEPFETEDEVIEKKSVFSRTTIDNKQATKQGKNESNHDGNKKINRHNLKENKLSGAARKPESNAESRELPDSNGNQRKLENVAKSSKIPIKQKGGSDRTPMINETPPENQIPVPVSKTRRRSVGKKTTSGGNKQRNNSSTNTSERSDLTGTILAMGNCLALENGTEQQSVTGIKPGYMVVARIRNYVIVGEVKMTCKIRGLEDSIVYAGVKFEKPLTWAYPTLEVRHGIGTEKGFCEKCNGGKSLFIPCNQIKNKSNSIFQVIIDQ